MSVLIDYTKGFFETTEGDTVGTVTGNATLDLSTGSVFSHTPTANTTFAFSNPPASGTASSATLKLTGANVVAGYDLANASYDSVSLSVISEESLGHDIFFKPDGTKVYLLGTSGDDVNEYSLSTAWDLSTASYVQNFSVSAQETGPSGIFFKPDGTKMYITGTSGDDVNEYNLSTAWDISTASYSQVFSVAAQMGNPRAIFFKGDGTKMFIADQTGPDINEYSLSTGWDVSTASFTQLFSTSSQATSPQAIYFSPDGTEMFVGDAASDIYKYSLSTAWDLSTASYASITFDASSQNTVLLGLSFKDDGSKMYTLDNQTDAIYQYSTTGSSALATITYPSSVIWSGGTTPTAPANGETDVYTFYTDDGGTTYYGFQVGDALA